MQNMNQDNDFNRYAHQLGIENFNKNSNRAEQYKNAALVLLNASIGLKLNEKNTLKQTPLMLALKNKWNDVALSLLKKGANITLKDNLEKTALMYAFENYNPNDSSIITILVNETYDTTADHDKSKKTALMYACDKT